MQDTSSSQPPHVSDASDKDGFVWQSQLHATGSGFQADYHDNPRPEAVERLDIVPNCVLEIGCGSGATGKLIKEKFPHAKVIGVESNLPAAEVARTRMDRVYATTFESLDVDAADFPKAEVDAALLLDVLEHMYDPWRMLVKLKTVLTPKARVLI